MTNKTKTIINKIVLSELTAILDLIMMPIYLVMAFIKYNHETRGKKLRMTGQAILDWFGTWFMMIYMPYRIIRNHKEENNGKTIPR